MVKYDAIHKHIGVKEELLGSGKAILELMEICDEKAAIRRKVSQKKYYEKNKEKIFKYQKRYLEQNRDKINSYQKEYYQKNKNKVRRDNYD